MFCILYIIIKIGNRMIYDVNISLCFSLRPLRLCGNFFSPQRRKGRKECDTANCDGSGALNVENNKFKDKQIIFVKNNKAANNKQCTPQEEQLFLSCGVHASRIHTPWFRISDKAFTASPHAVFRWQYHLKHG